MLERTLLIFDRHVLSFESGRHDIVLKKHVYTEFSKYSSDFSKYFEKDDSERFSQVALSPYCLYIVCLYCLYVIVYNYILYICPLII